MYQMLMMMTMDKTAPKESKRSVAPAEYQKYLQMKEQLDREAGIIPFSQQATQSKYLNHVRFEMSRTVGILRFSFFLVCIIVVT